MDLFSLSYENIGFACKSYDFTTNINAYADNINAFA